MLFSSSSSFRIALDARRIELNVVSEFLKNFVAVRYESALQLMIICKLANICSRHLCALGSQSLVIVHNFSVILVFL